MGSQIPRSIEHEGYIYTWISLDIPSTLLLWIWDILQDLSTNLTLLPSCLQGSPPILAIAIELKPGLMMATENIAIKAQLLGSIDLENECWIIGPKKLLCKLLFGFAIVSIGLLLGTLSLGTFALDILHGFLGGRLLGLGPPLNFGLCLRFGRHLGLGFGHSFWCTRWNLRYRGKPCTFRINIQG